MKTTMEILGKIKENSSKNKDEVFTRLYRYLLRPEIYYLAYQNLYANKGAATKGIDEDTADGFSEEKISKIIESLTNGSYEPKPSRRTYIKKANGTMRPLGIPTFTDKLVQEVLRMILEAVYEPIFSDYSHGFRPKRSCHMALMNIKKGFNGVKWFIEGDIKGCFDSINHAKLIEVLNAKIKDARLMQLIWKFLKAGYLENWNYNATYSGTPQGGIVSPLLANIYLNELDKFVEKLKTDFDKPTRRNLYTPEYNSIRKRVDYIRLKLKTEKNADKIQSLVTELKEARAKMLKTPSKSQTDKIIKYVRYADDFIIGVKGSKEECECIKSELTKFIGVILKMELSQEKTLVTHSSEYARFLGYDICIRRNNEVRGTATGNTQRSLSGTVELCIPLSDKIEKYLWKIKAVRVKDGTLFPIERTALVGMSELEIISSYNAELRGICNYYGIASNFSKLNYFAYLMEYSCLKTLATKHKSTLAKIIAKYKDGKGGWAIPYETKKGKKRMWFAKWQDSKNDPWASDLISTATLKHMRSLSTFETRLKAKSCELCGIDNAEHYEIHHVNKLKNLKATQPWEHYMLAKKRKTMVVCRECHKKIHGKKEEII